MFCHKTRFSQKKGHILYIFILKPINIGLTLFSGRITIPEFKIR